MQETKNHQVEEDEKVIKSLMRKVVAKLFDSHVAKLKDRESFDLNEELSKSTQDLCLVASAQMLALLSKNYPHLFLKKMILKCTGVELQPFKANGEWRWHAVAIVQSTISSKWYAFSPANLGNYGESYQSILTADTLADLILEIEKQEGGIWQLSDVELSKIYFENYIPAFYTTELNKLCQMDDNSFYSAVEAYNNALTQDNLTANRNVVQKIIEKIKST